MSLALKGLKDIKWPVVDLPDLVFFQEGPGVRRNQYTEDGVKLLNVANLQKGKVDLSTSERYISEEEAYGRYKHFLADEGDLIIASSGIKIDYFEDKMGFLTKEHLPLCMNTSTIRFKSLDDNVLNIRYFMYFLKTNFFKGQLQRLITGSAQLNFGPSHLKQIKVILPEIKIQNQIVGLLDLTSDLIDKRQQQIEALSDLKQSVFLDMFGDPNDKGSKFSKEQIGNLFEVQTGKTPKRGNSDFWEGGDIPWVKTTEVNNKRIEGTSEFITKRALEVNNLKIFPENTVIIAMYGQGKTRGQSALLTFPSTCNQACAAVLPNDKYNHLFLWNQLLLQYENLRALGRGGNQPNLNLTLVREFKIINPPIVLQEEYANIVEKIDKQKDLLSDSLEQINTLYNSLLQKAFNGELFKEKTNV